MPRMRVGLAFALTAVLASGATSARADVHLVRINEFYTRCDNGSTSIQYIELRDYIATSFFRQCASIEVRRTVGGPIVWSALPVFAGRGDGEAFTTGRTWLIGSTSFQAKTGIAPDLVMPDGTLDPAGGVIRFAADSGCAFDWGTIHEVRYGDQSLPVPNIPAPARHQAANYNNTLNTWTLGARSPRNFPGSTTTTWTCDSQPPTVTVNAANGGEIWEAGSSQNITWTANDDVAVTSIKLEFSADNGGSYALVANGEPNDGTFAWSVPATLTTQALIRITASDAVSNATVDVSNATFSIVDTTPPGVSVVAPNGGETWIEGTTQVITWSATDLLGVTDVDLFFSTDNGGNYASIALAEANDGSYNWTIPGTPSVQALVRVVARDGSSNSGVDVSDAVFTIQTASSVPWLPREVRAPVLLQNRPNPFNPVTRIGFALPQAGPARLAVFTLEGRLVRDLADQVFPAGYSELVWDGRDATGRPAASGVYLYALDVNGRRETRKLTLSK